MRRRSTACPASVSTRIRPPRPSSRRRGKSPAAVRRSPSIRRRTTRSAPSTRLEAGRGRAVHGRLGGHGARYLISGLPRRPRPNSSTSLALVAERTAAERHAGEEAAHRPVPAVVGSMDEGWTRWLLEQYGFEFVILHPEDFHSPLRDKVDVIILADDARLPVAGGGRGGRRRRRRVRAGRRRAAPRRRRSRPEGAAGGRGGARAVRPEYAYTLTADDLKASRRSSAAAARSSASTAPTASPSSSSSCRSRTSRTA